MPSTETRRLADLITLIREVVNEVFEDDESSSIEHMRRQIWNLANKEERNAIIKFCKWFEERD